MEGLGAGPPGDAVEGHASSASIETMASTSFRSQALT